MNVFIWKQQEIDMLVNPKPFIFTLHTFLFAKMSKLGLLEWNKINQNGGLNEFLNFDTILNILKHKKRSN